MSEVVQAEEKAQYLLDLAKVASRNGAQWLAPIRASGAARFRELNFPHHKQEEWRFTNVNPLVRTPFRSVVEPPARRLSAQAAASFLYGIEDWVELVFVDGFLAPELSRGPKLPEGVRVGSLAQAIREEPDLVRAHLARSPAGNGTNSNAFTALNSAFLLDGAFVYAPRGVVVEQPIHLLFVTTQGREGTAAHPRNLVIAEPHAQLTLIETHASILPETEYFNNEVTEMSVGEGATVRRYRIVQEGRRAYHLSTSKVRLGKDSSFHSWLITGGGRITRSELAVVLDGEGAQCTIRGLYMTDGEQLADSFTAIDHAKPGCSSSIASKGILEGHSSAVYTGKVLVRPRAQKTDSNQLNKNLILSDEATVDAQPVLEIYADDVKCTHGATVGPPPRDVLFYFQSRGVSEALARAMLTCGFASEVINSIQLAPVRDRLSRLVFDRYSPSART